MTQGYLFAHRLLPDLVFSEPGTARERLGDVSFVRQLWTHAGMHASQGTPRDVVEGLSVLREGSRTVICCPLPAEPPEAHFVAVDWACQPPRFTTLELGDSLGGEPTNYLCGWLEDGTHTNHGEGHAAVLESFLKALDGE
jgi:hypothetical protein